MKPPIISVNMYDPLIRDDFQFYRRIIPDKYGHTITAFGGYNTAQITIATTKSEAEDWLENGLMRHVKVFGAALDVIWEGFVNEIRVNMGPLSATLGPLTNIANEVTVSYTPIVVGDATNVSGSQTWTPYQLDLDSQARYGVWWKIFNGGSAVAARAEDLRDTYLEHSKWPKLTESWNAGSNRPVTVTLNCLGYFHMLKYPVHFLSAGVTTLDGKIVNALGENPNLAWLPFNEDNIDASTVNLPQNENSFRLAMTIIKEAVSMGDGAPDYNRWLFYILNDRKCYYHQAPDEVEYRAYIRDGGVVLESDTQAEIQPWRLLPGKWLAFYDFLVGRNITDIAEDPRMMFVEKVTYRAPFGLQLQGGNTDEITQMLATFGLIGTGGAAGGGGGAGGGPM